MSVLEADIPKASNLVRESAPILMVSSEVVRGRFFSVIHLYLIEIYVSEYTLIFYYTRKYIYT